MKNTLGQVSGKKTSPYLFAKVPEHPQSEADLQWHLHFPSITLWLILSFTIFYEIFASLFKMENDSNFAFMLKFL